MTATVRTVARYLNDPFYGNESGWPSDVHAYSLYSYEDFCGACERHLEKFYPHLGMRFCPYCGVALTRGQTEGIRVEGGPWEHHPLLVQEASRRTKRDREDQQKHKADWMCRRCGNTEWTGLPVGPMHNEPTVEERLWNPTPEGKHSHQVCSQCGNDRIVWILDGPGIMASYKPDLPMSGPLADHEIAE